MPKLEPTPNLAEQLMSQLDEVSDDEDIPLVLFD